MSGLRIGWIIDHDPLRRERYRNARNYFTITANVFGERLAVLALEHSQNIYARARHVAREYLVLLEQVLAEHHGVLRWMRPRGGMTAFPWLADGADSREFCRRFAKSGVRIVPGDCFVAGAPVFDYQRLNITHVWMAQRVFADNFAGNLAFDKDGDGVPESLTKWEILRDAVVAKCDGLDGIRDGVIDTVRYSRK